MTIPPVAVVMAAAGSGSRVEAPGAPETPFRGVPKQWRPLGGIPLIARSFRFFDQLDAIGQFAIALDAESIEKSERTSYLRSEHDKRVHLTTGGDSRQDSVRRALEALDPEPEIVLVHDAARPFPPREGVEACIREARRRGGAILAHPVTETIKRVDLDGNVRETLNRQDLWAAQTPQAFRFRELMEANRAAADRLATFTDDAAIYETWGGCVHIVPGTEENFKVTVAEDFDRAERILELISSRSWM